MKIFFIRHGETTGDVEDRYGGDYDDHLSGEGKRQCTALATALATKDIEIIFTSPLLRAQETAEILSQQSVCDVEIIPDLRERNQYGILTGLKKEKAKDLYPTEVEMVKDRLNTIEGAESYQDFSYRVREAFKEVIAHTKYSTIAVVTHGGPLRVLFRDFLEWGELTQIGDCSYVELEIENGDFSWVDSSGLVPAFDIAEHHSSEALDGDGLYERRN